MEYQLHLPEYLAKCINLDRPQLNCNGQCVLMQKIREKEKEERKKNAIVFEYNALYMHKEYMPFAIKPPVPTAIQSGIPNPVQHYAFTYNTSIFRPPVV